MLSHTWWIFESMYDQNSGTLQPRVIVTWLTAAFICINMFVCYYLYWVCVRLYPWREINPNSKPDYCLNLKQISFLALNSGLKSTFEVIKTKEHRREL